MNFSTALFCSWVSLCRGQESAMHQNPLRPLSSSPPPYSDTLSIVPPPHPGESLQRLLFGERSQHSTRPDPMPKKKHRGLLQVSRAARNGGGCERERERDVPANLLLQDKEREREAKNWDFVTRGGSRLGSRGRKRHPDLRGAGPAFGKREGRPPRPSRTPPLCEVVTLSPSSSSS